MAHITTNEKLHLHGRRLAYSVKEMIWNTHALAVTRTANFNNCCYEYQFNIPEMASQVHCKVLSSDAKARVGKAQSIIFDWDTACNEVILKTLKAHAVVAPTEFIFFPRLTVTASFMLKVREL